MKWKTRTTWQRLWVETHPSTANKLTRKRLKASSSSQSSTSRRQRCRNDRSHSLRTWHPRCSPTNSDNNKISIRRLPWTQMSSRFREALSRGGMARREILLWEIIPKKDPRRRETQSWEALKWAVLWWESQQRKFLLVLRDRQMLRISCLSITRPLELLRIHRINLKVDPWIGDNSSKRLSNRSRRNT